MAGLFHLTTAAGRRLWRLGVRLAWITGLVGLATLPLALGAFADVRRSEVSAEDGYRLRDVAAKATVWTCVLLCLALWISRAAG